VKSRLSSIVVPNTNGEADDDQPSQNPGKKKEK
jgi:hypothetical protein